MWRALSVDESKRPGWWPATANEQCGSRCNSPHGCPGLPQLRARWLCTLRSGEWCGRQPVLAARSRGRYHRFRPGDLRASETTDPSSPSSYVCHRDTLNMTVNPCPLNAGRLPRHAHSHCARPESRHGSRRSSPDRGHAGVCANPRRRDIQGIPSNHGPFARIAQGQFRGSRNRDSLARYPSLKL